MRKVLDIETNKLLADLLDYSSFPYKLKKEAKLYCISIFNIDTGELLNANNEQITREWLKKALSDCTELITHNGIKFDLPLL